MSNNSSPTPTRRVQLLLLVLPVLGFVDGVLLVVSMLILGDVAIVVVVAAAAAAAAAVFGASNSR